MSDETTSGQTVPAGADPSGTATGVDDAASLTLDELRALRTELQQRDDVVSYARRVAQARLDLVKSELSRRESGGEVSDEVADVLSQHLTGGPARPPRPAEDLSDDALSVELDGICAEHHFGRLEELDEAELGVLADAIDAFERRVSQDRQIGRASCRERVFRAV